MSKVNIGLRGWRFDEGVLGPDGRVRPLKTMEPETRQRLLVLAERVVDPCDACWLIHGDEDIEQCNVADAIYGEPMGEVVVCSAHETDFIYWFREEGGEAYAGDTDLASAFHEWFLDGNRAPEGYVGLEHVDEDPTALPEAPDRDEAIPGLEEEVEQMDEDDLDTIDMDLSDLDV
ncbi:hypothetical protein [Haloarcula argentinensis]|uniref:Uncharacterized protein n=1 Tax=Haloarcula argentinensis TaxID=43776 RepID=A0A830FTL1_HALAR|nr:hypothetical protein [Haloarcula argentinensis]EMA23779.1 hypothetical protein C443_08943 [Haloarcula argentinensis DSM 12282]MDS0252618.1 hypothetical protein [Haloarcula argentinensis]GGM30917.1 hypothetical protein GCM10009006_10550 [Haloarcula argentinensis]